MLKKTLIYGLIYVTVFMFFYTQSLSAANVVEYYNEIPESLSGQNYMLKKVNNKWAATKYEASIPDVEVDINNGYIHIGDEGTGAGRLTTAIALFKSRQGVPYIAISTKNFLGVPIKDYTIDVFQKTGSGWKNVTAAVLPKIKIADFLSGQPMNHHAIRTMKTKNVIDFVLPRRGTEINVNFDMACIDYLLTIQDTPADAKKAYLHLKKIAVFKTIGLKWDSVRAKFAFSKKIPNSGN